MYEQIIKKYPHVIAVIGEGEYAVSELIKAFESKATLETVDGIAFYKNGQVVQTKPRELIYDLDSIPFPKHEVFFDNESNRTIGHIITSRGCPYDCSFCCLKAISKRQYRKRDITNVVNEIKSLKQKYPRLKHIQIHDDAFLLYNSRVIQFCKMVVDANLKLTFECSARVKPISSEMFYWMERAGFTKIMFGLETGSQKLLKSIHKNINKNDVINLFKTLKPFNFTITTFLMCGFPGENDKTISETIDLVQTTQKIHYSWIAGVGKLWVYPGTEVYDQMKNAGQIDDDFWLSDKSVPYYTVEHNSKKLIEFENKIMYGVAIDRILTLRGFKNHFLKMPMVITKYILQNKEFVTVIFGASLKLNFPNIHAIIHKLYKN
ncbi:MAG: Ribosomal protein S12 methylthiotransferase RimO [Candidatus Argoarchaeum ethanivorans]|uniref:Ribosomal protein S12 methylthiotransferase RimO n=1 Tax=Candidatus Argoarchaeum ethanivorans TaxID=2608793 RepID=A0A811TAY4_9EURY|nr:MAG: Ribosomal protein S12 methylthiotransferase RimO [Candidatus Argoarchaeum ethanivorans]